MKQLTEEVFPYIKKPFEWKGERNIEEENKRRVKDEADGKRPPITREGKIIKIVGEGENRILILDYQGIYIYLMNNELPDKKQKCKDEELLNQEIRFKIIGKYEKKIIASCKYVEDFYKTAMAHGKIIKGKIYSINPNKRGKGYYAIVNSKQDRIIIPSEELSLPDFVLPQDRSGRIIEFVIIEVKHNGKIIGSSRIVSEYRKEQLNYFYDIGETFKAEVERVNDVGAFLIFKHNNSLVLRNKDFSSNYTNCNEVLEKGDIVNVKIKKITSSERYVVELVNKYYKDPSVDFGNIKVEDEYEGKVVTVEPFGCFVRIDAGRDVLCPITADTREPIVGNKVKIKVITSDKGNNKLRGKIISYEDDLPDISEFHLFD